MSALTFLGEDDARPLLDVHPVGAALEAAGYALALDEDESTVWVDLSDHDRYMLGGIDAAGAFLMLWNMERPCLASVGDFASAFDGYVRAWAGDS